MKICILETDRPDEEFQPAHGTYGDMFENWLGPALPEAQFVRIHVAAGEPLPDDPLSFDGYLITGSRAGVYEDHPWIEPLSAFLRKVRALQIPVAGVCFGHQIIAQAFGGKVSKAAAGWILGRQEHLPTGEGADMFGSKPLTALSFHQDQITSLPEGAKRLLANADSPNGGLLYEGFPALSVQFHPEFHPAYVRDLLGKFGGGRIPGDRAETALVNLDGELEGDRVARGFAEFFRTQIRAREQKTG